MNALSLVGAVSSNVKLGATEIGIDSCTAPSAGRVVFLGFQRGLFPQCVEAEHSAQRFQDHLWQGECLREWIERQISCCPSSPCIDECQ